MYDPVEKAFHPITRCGFPAGYDVKSRIGLVLIQAILRRGSREAWLSSNIASCGEGRQARRCAGERFEVTSAGGAWTKRGALPAAVGGRDLRAFKFLISFMWLQS